MRIQTTIALTSTIALIIGISIGIVASTLMTPQVVVDDADDAPADRDDDDGVEATPANAPAGMVADQPAADEPAHARDAAEIGRLQRRIADLTDQLVAVRADHAELSAAHAEATARLAGFDAEQAATRPAFTFGPETVHEALAATNWREIGQAHRAAQTALRDLLHAKQQGSDGDFETKVALQQNVEKLRTYEYRVIGDLPGNSNYNKEFSHPITAANMVAAALRDAGLPLTDAQVAQIAGFGEQYMKDFDAQQERYTPTTLRVTKIVDEMVLKNAFTDAMFAALTPAQRDVVTSDEIRGVGHLDLLSPVLMLLDSPVLPGETTDEIATKAVSLLRNRLQLTDEQLAQCDAALTAWRRDATATLTPVAKLIAPHYSFTDAVAAGRASAALYEAIRFECSADAELYERITNEHIIIIPRLVEPAADAAPNSIPGDDDDAPVEPGARGNTVGAGDSA
jgi:hypothetical protein